MTDMVTVAEYARSRGVTASAVHRMIGQGALPCAMVDGERMVDPDTADDAWGIRRERFDTPPESAAAGKPDDLRAARLARELHAGELLGIKAARARGELVLKADVRRDILDAAAIILGAWETLPDRLAPTMVGIDDQARIRAILRNEIEQLQQQISEALEGVVNGRPKLDTPHGEIA